MTRLLIAATVVATLPLFCAWFVKDIYLGDTHNAVETETIDSEAGRSLDSIPLPETPQATV